ncbi:MAG: hypothetical protein Q9225_004542 [Loekoesia sp. 1 TL-2023]
MRRSCNFCRSRKIRCSGQTICSACSERNIDCVYLKEASKGRPKGSIGKSTPRRPSRGDNDPVRSKILPAAVESSASSSRLVSSDSPPKFGIYRPAASERHDQTSSRPSIASEESNNTLASELEDMFDEDFKDAGFTKSNAFQESLAAFHRRVNHDPTSTLESILGSPVEDMPRRTISYAQLLYTMTQGLVEMLSVRFGNLECYQLKDPSARFYVVSLANDDTPTMFESATPEEVNPLDTFDSHRTIQMIEVWFSVHPLSNIVSKTLFLRNYRSNTHDPILLTVMLADASYVHEDNATGDQAEALFRWAVAQLRDRPASECGLSTVQMLMLLGWHELCLAHARRATCYLGYAGRIITKLQAKCVQMPETGRSQVNGIDVAQVEAELVRNIYWLAFSITLWSFMQIDQPYPQLLPSTIPTEFPPVDESSSAVIRLDIVSDNVSTLAKQTGMIHELWPLSHIASTTAHIYALLPRKHDMDEAAQSQSWQSQPLHQLRLLLSANRDISTLCINIRKVLVNAVKVLEVNVKNALSKALVLTAYHTTIIHLLFPHLDSPEDRIVVSEEILTDFCISAKSLLDLFSVVDAEHDTDHLITKIRSSTFADVFVLGLDVCSRAIDYFYARLQHGSALEAEKISRKAADLTSIVSDMHAISKSETLLTAKNLRLVKKKLKNVKLLFHSFGDPHGTGSSSSIEDDLGQLVNPPDAQISDLLMLDPNAPLSELWPSAAPMEFSSTPYNAFSGEDTHAFSQVGWKGNADTNKLSNDGIGATLGPSNIPIGPPKDDQMARGQQGHDGSAVVLGEDIHGLGNVGMDVDFSNLGFFGAGEGWPSASRPPMSSKKS